MIKRYKYIFSGLAVIAAIFVAGIFITSSPVGAYPPNPDGTCNGTDTIKETTDPISGTKTKNCEQTNATTTPGTTGTPQNGSTQDEGVTCAIKMIGWILCPIIETSGKIGDQAFSFLSRTFLETEPELVSSTDGKGTKLAWEMARNLANIMFIIAFLVIIYSQVTGAGISNYGIKKMLPRIIIAAIAVNVSYYICQALVDLTNIMGHEIQNFMVDAARSITSSTAMPIATGGDGVTAWTEKSGTLTTIAVTALALGAVAYFLLPVMGAVISLVLVSCLSIIIILLLRKAFIVLLIVAAPVAFVAYLLPNTEKYFQKWLTMFWKLLLVFPIVGMLMGGGQLASSIILAAGVSSQGSYSDPGQKCVTLPSQTKGQAATGASVGNCGTGTVPFMLGLTAAGISVLPLLAVYSVLKGALSAAGAIGGKIGATIGNMNNGRKANLSKRRQELGDERKDRRALKAIQNPGSIMGAGARRRAFRDARRASVKQQLGRATEDAVYDRAYDSETGELTAYGRRMAGAGLLGNGANQRSQDRVIRGMQGVEQKNEQEAVSAIQYQHRNDSTGDLQRQLNQAVADEDRIMIRAFAEALEKHGSAGANAIAAVVNSHGGSQDLRNVINNHTSIKSTRADVAAWATDGSGRNLAYHQGQSTTYSNLSDAQLASQTRESFEHAEAANVLDELVTVLGSDGVPRQVSRGASLSNVKEMSGENKIIAARH